MGNLTRGKTFYVLPEKTTEHYVGHLLWKSEPNTIVGWCGVTATPDEIRVIDEFDNIILWCSQCLDARIEAYSAIARKRMSDPDD